MMTTVCRFARLLAMCACLAAGDASAQFMKCQPLNEDERTQAEFCAAHISCAIAIKILESCHQLSAFMSRFFTETKGKSQAELERQPVPETAAAPREPEVYKSPAQRQRELKAEVAAYEREDRELASEMRNLNCGSPRSIDAQRCVDIGMRALDLQRQVEMHNGPARLGGASNQNLQVGPLMTAGMVSRDGGNFIVYPSSTPTPLRRGSGGSADLAGAVQKAAQDAPEAQRAQEQQEVARRATSVQLLAEESERRRREELATEARRRQADQARLAEAERQRNQAESAVASAGGVGSQSNFGSTSGISGGAVSIGNFTLTGNCSSDIERLGEEIKATQRRGAGDRSVVKTLQFAMYSISAYITLLERSCRGRPEHNEIPIWRGKFDEVKRTCLGAASNAEACSPRIPW